MTSQQDREITPHNACIIKLCLMFNINPNCKIRLKQTKILKKGKPKRKQKPENFWDKFPSYRKSVLSRMSKAREELLYALLHSAVPSCPASSVSLSAHMCHPPKETNRNDWSQSGTSVLQVDSGQEDFLCIIMVYSYPKPVLLSEWGHMLTCWHRSPVIHGAPFSQKLSTFHLGKKDP